MSAVKYLMCLLDESDRDGAECWRKLGSGKKIGVLSELVECEMVLQEKLILPVLLYGSETMIWREEETSSIMVVQMDNLRGLLGIRRMDRVPNERIRELCGETREVDHQLEQPEIRFEFVYMCG